MKLVGENLGSDLTPLGNYEAYYGEGDTGELRIYLEEPLSTYAIEKLEEKITSEGVTLTEPITQEARILVIRFRKMITPLLLIAGAVAVIGVGILGWQIWKTTTMGVPIWVWAIGGLSLAYLLFRKPVRKATPYAIHAGKVYITKKVKK